MIDYAENLCEAMKIILEKQIKQLSFDITIDATVVDATNAKNGMYVVSHDGATFTAYSTDTSFKEKDVVMVTIPQGNYDNQKMIIGKQVDKNKEEKPITYQSPFSQIVNLSGNLVYGNIGEEGLLANEGNQYQEEYQTLLKQENLEPIQEARKNELKSLIENAQKKVIYSLGEGEQVPLSEEYQSNGYTRIGLRADFSTWLNEFNVVSGNYGLILTLKFKNPDVTDLEENSIITAIYTFDSSEFFGDIYNFETYYNQEVVFDISDYSDYFLQGIKLEAYQLDNFETSNGELLSYNNMLSEPTDNIFIKEPFICLGTAVGEFKKDSIKIVTNSSSTYATAENVKYLKLKWTHQDLNSKDIYVVQEGKIPANYEIRWYKFELGEPSPDKFMDAHWIRLNNENNKINISFSPDPANQTEQIRAIVLKTENNNPTTLVARSPIITFSNNNEVPNQANLELQKIDANALGIQFTDAAKGKYYYYNKIGKILQQEKSQEIRTLKAIFKDNTILEDKQDLHYQTYTLIEWTFPKGNTMIIPLTPNGEEITENSIIEDVTIDQTNENYYKFSFSSFEGNKKSVLETFKYKINENYSFNKSRNTVYLKTIINGQIYISSTTMFFGISGTSGSDYTIIVDWGETGQDPPVFEVKNDGILKGSVRLQDPNGENVNLNENAEYEYSWYQIKKGENLDGLSIIDKENNNSLGENNSIFKLKNINSQVTMNDLYVLEVKLKNFGDYNLIARYPIALKRGSDNFLVINNITGTTTVRYASDGTITSDNKNPYSISFQYYNSEEENFIPANEKDSFGYWYIIKNNEIKDFFLPELIETAENNNIIIAFISKLKSIEITNDKTLLDIILQKKIRQKDNIQTQEPIDLLIYNIENDEEINSGIPMLEENFKQYLYTVKNSVLKKLFFTLEKIYPAFSSSNFKKINPILSPPSIYFKNIPLYGIQYILNNPPQNISNNITSENNILYTQPIYVYQDNYPSTTINQWNGKEMIFNEEEGTFITNGLSAGKKEEDDNTFSGVMIGDWSDSSISNMTGIYGFNHGIMSYAFKENGTAFIGKDGVGRIEFDGNKSIIQSAYFNLEEKIGSQFNLKEGSLYLFGEKDYINDKNKLYSLTLNSNPNNNNDPIFSVDRDVNISYYQNKKFLMTYKENFDNLKEYLKEYKESLLQNFLFIYLYENNEERDNEIQTFQDYITTLKSELEEPFLNEEENPILKDTIKMNLLKVSPIFIKLSPYQNLSDYVNINLNQIANLNEQKEVFIQLDSQNQGDNENYTCQYVPANKENFSNEKIYFDNNHQKIKNPEEEQVENYEEKKYIFTKIFNDDKINLSQDFSSYYYPNEKYCYFYSFSNDFFEILLNYYIEYLYLKQKEIKDNNEKLKSFLSIINNEIGEDNYFKNNPIKTDGMVFMDYKENVTFSKKTYFLECTFEDDESKKYYKALNDINKNAGGNIICYTSGQICFPNKKLKTIKVFYQNATKSSTLKFQYEFKNPKWGISSNPIPFNNYVVSFYHNSARTGALQDESEPSNNTSISIIPADNFNTLQGFYLLKQKLKNKYIKNNIFLNNSTSELINITSSLQANINSYIDDIYKWERYDNYNITDETNNNLRIITLDLTSENSSIYTIKINTQKYEDEQNQFFIPLFQDTSENSITSSSYSKGEIGFLPLDWTNDLICLNKKGGYLTSVDYRPTMDYWATTVKKPTDNQKWGTRNIASPDYTYGMKGFVIDLTNNRIVLGNNSSIIGYQSDYRLGYEKFGLRQFYIGTGCSYGQPDQNGIEYLSQASEPKNSHFIRAKSALTSSRDQLIDIFAVRWDGMTYCRELFVHRGFYFGSESNKVKRGHFTTTSSGLVFKDQDTGETVTNPRILYF